MGAVLVVLLQPRIQVGMEFLQCPIDLPPERHEIEPFQHRLVEAFTDPVRLRIPGLGALRSGVGRRTGTAIYPYGS